jgi:dienelactone hydrolase
MSVARRAVVAAAVALVALGGARARAAEPDQQAGRNRAAEFARRFLAGEHEPLQAMMTAEMRAAFPPGPAEELRAGLLAQQGKLEELGQAWHEDVVQGFHRYRVPARFANGTLDLRVVLDAEARIAGLFFVPHLEPPERRVEPEAPRPEIDVRVGDDERGLPGVLVLPSGAGPFPGVVLVHGSGPQDRDETIGPNKPFRDLAWGLVERGIAVLRYDKRTLARSADFLELGDRLTVQHEVLDDARAALSLLRARAEVDPRRVFVLGHSLGGTLAPRIAALEPRPAGMIVLAGSTLPLPEKMLEQTRYIVNLDGSVSSAEQARLLEIETAVREIRAALDGTGPAFEGYRLGAPLGYYRDLERHDPPAEAAALGLPALVLQGARDYQVTLDDFRRWETALSGKAGACLVRYERLDHLFREGEGPSGPHDYERPARLATVVLDDVARWIREGRCPER